MRRITLVVVALISFIYAENDLLEVGAPAPTFVLQSASGGREYLRVWSGERLMKLYINKVPRRVILSFWSTTCVPCMKEIPELHRFVQAHEEDSMKVFLVNLDRHSAAELKKFSDEQGWSLPILMDPYQNTGKRYGVSAIPTVYVISPEGTIEHAFTGIPEGETADSYLEKLIYSEQIDSTVVDSAMVMSDSASVAVPAQE